MPSDLIRGWIPVRVKKTRQTKRLVQRIAAARHAVEAYRRIELRQFRFQLLVDEEQRLQCAADVAIAGRHDLVDGRFACVGNHGSSSDCTWNNILVPARV